MISKIKKEFIKNKLKIAMRIKSNYKYHIIKSIIRNNSIGNLVRAVWSVKWELKNNNITKLNDICLNSGVYKKSNKKNNLSRHEFHKACRNNKLSGWSTSSW